MNAEFLPTQLLARSGRKWRKSSLKSDTEGLEGMSYQYINYLKKMVQHPCVDHEPAEGVNNAVHMWDMPQ